MQIKKRNDQEVEFRTDKIEQAIFKALNATDSDTSCAYRLTQKVVTIIEALFDKKTPSVEDVQDVVEQILINENLGKTAKAYILYRNQHARLRNEQHVINNYIDLIENYISLNDWKVNENSNMGYSLQGLNNYISSHVSSMYWLHKIYDEEITQEHLSGRIHIHDLGILAVYCCGWDLFDLLCGGLGGVSSKIESKPPKHLASALGQIVNFFYTLQGECYSEDTTVLTNSGWKYFYDTTNDDEFCTLNLITKKIEYQKRLGYIERDHIGQLINFTNDKVDQLVTENHKMLILDYSTKRTAFKLAKDVTCSDAISKVGSFEDMNIENFNENKIETIDYFGKVYCVEVPNQTLFVCRNGKPSWGGNCAGAQAFSNFDTLLAPYIRYDGLNRDQIKQELQEFIFNTNVPTRVGFQCMSEDTEILTSNCWKKYFEVQIGDSIKTFNIETKNIEDQIVNKVFSSEYHGKMYSIKNDETDQLISPKHRVVVSSNKQYELKTIENCLKNQSFQIPLLQDPYIKNITIQEEHITEIDYKGIIWCPNTINETVIARRNGKIFITGNTPFTNITMDLEVPNDYKNMPVIIGGEPQKETYGEFQKEMDIFNDVFCEVMMEGDSKGRIFTFPIPTYNLTVDFNWDNPNLNNLWKMTAKYGIPYFANFINSDMKPDDIRSMCPLTGDTEVIVKSDQEITIKKLCHIIHDMEKNNTQYQVWDGYSNWKNVKSVKTIDDTIYKIKISNGSIVKMGSKHIQPVLINGIIINKSANELETGMWIPYNKKNLIENDNTEIIIETKKDNTYNYYKIESIEIEIEKNNHSLYCFEVEGDHPYFTLADGMITHNCRLRLDNTVLRKRGGGLFASNPMTGSIGVVTLNLPHLAHTSKTKDEFFEKIYNSMLIARRSLKTKRAFLEKNTENGLYPYCKHYLDKIKKNNLKQYWSNHFNTIGIIGMNEACLNLLNASIATEEGKKLAIETLNFMRDKLSEFQIQDDMLYNLEAAPSEGSSYRLAEMDKRRFPDIKTAGITEPYYTNSTHLPVNHTNDIFDALHHQNDIQPLYTGGSLFNGFLGEQISNPNVCKELVKKIAENFNMSYFTITPTFSICSVHGYITGEHHLCPTMSKAIK